MADSSFFTVSFSKRGDGLFGFSIFDNMGVKVSGAIGCASLARAEKVSQQVMDDLKRVQQVDPKFFIKKRGIS